MTRLTFNLSHLQHARAERLVVGVARGDFECLDQHFRACRPAR